MRVLAVLALALLCAPSAFAQNSTVTGETPSGREIIEREGESDIIRFERADDAMNAAIADARAHLSYFWERMARRARGEDDFTIKVGFAVNNRDGTTREHIWVDNIRPEGGGYLAELANEPNWMEGKRLGDKVTFTEDMISDWGFARRDKMIGFYTIRVMLPELDPIEAAEIRSRLGENPE